MKKMIFEKLCVMQIEYNTQRSPEELALLAEEWAEELQDVNIERVVSAFKIHRRSSERFPTLSSILKVLPPLPLPIYESSPAALPAARKENPNWRQRVAEMQKHLACDIFGGKEKDAKRTALH